MKIAVIVPIRNEEGNIARLLGAFASSPLDPSSVFLIEGNSIDGTFETLLKQNEAYGNKFQVLRQSFIGKFGATRTFLQTEKSNQFTHVFIWDSDLTIPIEDNLRLLAVSRANPEAFVTGSRLISSIRNRSMPALNFLGNCIFSLIWSVAMKTRPLDVLCGSKIALISDLKSLPREILDSDYYGDICLLFSSVINKRKFLSQKVNYVKRSYGLSNIKPFSGGSRITSAMLTCFRFRYRRVRD